MRIEQLRYLLHIADSGSISRSAEALSISQQGLSQSMHQLERELDVKLLYREGNRTKLTAAAKMLRRDIERILKSCDNMYEIISANTLMGRAGEQGCSLRVTPHFCIAVMPAVMQRISRMYPHLHLSVTETEIVRILETCDFGTNELYILTCPERFMPDILTKNGVKDFCELSRVKIHAVVHKSHPLAGSDSITTDDLLQYPMALLGNDIHMLRSITGERFSEVNVLLHTTNFDLYRSASQMKNVISLTVPLAYERQNSPDLRRIPLDGAETILFGYIVNEYLQQTAVARELINMIESELHKMEQSLSHTETAPERQDF